MIAVGVHVYAGGFTCGVKDSFEVVAHLENDPPYAAATSRANFPDVPIFAGRHTWPNPSDDACPTKYKKVSLVYSNPPCAVFSPLGRNFMRALDWKADKRLDDWRSAVDYALEVDADAFVGESVPRILTKGREFAVGLSRKFMDHGYGVYWYNHDLKFHGLPQQRRRAMIIASKHELKFPVTQVKQKTIKEVLESVNKTDHHNHMSDIESELIPHVPPWKGFTEIYDKHLKDVAGGKGRPRFVMHRLGYDGISSTVAGDYIFHPIENRRLTVEEYAGLCGYPADYKWVFDGSKYQYGKTISEIARAVMPPVASAVAEIIYTGLRKGNYVNEPRVTHVVRWGKSLHRNDMTMISYDMDITDKVIGG